MKIALLGGTGDIGEGLALRWALNTDHELIIGSRTTKKAQQCAEEYLGRVQLHDSDATLSGASNAVAAADADVVVLSVPPVYITDTIEEIAESLTEETIIITPAVAMSRDKDGFHYDSQATEDSVTAVVKEATPANVATVGAFHNLPADRLGSLDAPLGIDTVVVADDDNAANTVVQLAESIDGLRAVRGGSIENAPEVEAITPLLINLAMNNDQFHHLGVKFK